MSDKFKGSLFVFFGAASFGILSTFVKKAYADGFSLGEVVGVQVFFGAVVLWCLYLLQSRIDRTQQTTDKNERVKKTAIWKVVLAGVNSGIVSVTYYSCVKLVPASIAIILLMQFVWMSILLEAVLFKKQPNKLQIWAIVIVLLGTCFASGMFSAQISELSLAGIGYGLLAALAYSLFLLVNGRVGNEMPPLKKSALMVTGSCLFIFILFPPTFLFSGVLLLDLPNGALFWLLLAWLFHLCFMLPECRKQELLLRQF